MTEQIPPPPPYPPPPLYPPPSAPRRRRRVLATVLTGVSAVVIVAVAVVVPLVVGSAEPTLDDVRTSRDLDFGHAEGDVDYPQTPQVGGPHGQAWLECGVYDVPVRDENAVHDLEHVRCGSATAPACPRRALTDL